MKMLSINELANSSGWPVSRIRRLARTKRLAHVKVDGITLLPASAIDDFVQRNLVEPVEPSGKTKPAQVAE
jgi:hypothetical protein